MFSGASGGPVLAGLKRLEPARIAGVHRGAGKGEAGVAMLVDAVVDERRQMLVARDVEGKRLAHQPQGCVPLLLRPAVGVVIGDQAAFRASRAWWPSR